MRAPTIRSFRSSRPILTLLVVCSTACQGGAVPSRRAEAAPPGLVTDPELLRQELSRLDAAIDRSPADARLWAERGRANLQFADCPEAGTPAQRAYLLQDAITDLRRARTLGAPPRDTTASLARALASAGRADEAFTVAADHFDVVGGADREMLRTILVDQGDASGRLTEAIERLHADEASSRWHRGKARYLHALDLATAGPEAAATEWLAAEADFVAAMAHEPGFAPSCRVWRAMCLTSRSKLAFAAGRLDENEALLLEAVQSAPDALHVSLGDGDSLHRCLLRHGDRIMRDFGRTERFFRAAFAAAPHDVDLANNAAVYARDHAFRLAKAGRTDEARTMFERSYATYQRAVALAPHSVRLRNDCALVAIHHLHTDLDAAGAMLQQAIRDGEQRLRDLPTSGAGRLDEEEALGDCCENLALWHLEHTKDHKAAANAARRALELHPGASRPGATKYLAAAESP